MLCNLAINSYEGYRYKFNRYLLDIFDNEEKLILEVLVDMAIIKDRIEWRKK